MSQRYDLSGIAGDDLEFDFNLTSAGSPVNLAGYTLSLYLKPTSASPDVIATVFTTSSGLTVTNAAGGQFTWVLPHTSYSISPPGSLWYRVDLTTVGNTETAMFGSLWLSAA